MKLDDFTNELGKAGDLQEAYRLREKLSKKAAKAQKKYNDLAFFIRTVEDEIRKMEAVDGESLGEFAVQDTGTH